MIKIKIIDNFENLEKALQKTVDETLRQFSEEMVQQIKAVTPTDKKNRIGKGDLRKSVSVEYEGNTAYITASSEHMSKYGKAYGYYKQPTPYNYAYEQHEDESLLHEDGTHHFITNTLYKNEELLKRMLIDNYNKNVR